jgi:hypothetical protein
LGPFNLYTDESFSQLELFDILNGQVTLEGGFDARPADGNGINFRFGATFSPEAERNLVWVGDGQANLWDIDTSEDWMSSLGKERFLN